MTSLALPVIKQPIRTSRRWVAALIATVLLHLLVLHLATEHISLPEHKEAIEKTVEISLRPEPAKASLKNTPSKPASKPAAPVRPRPKPAPAPVVEADTSVAAFTAAGDSAIVPVPPQEAGEQTANEAPKAEQPDAAPAVPPATSAPAQAQEEPAPQCVVAPPPSARLALELSSTKPGQANPYYGEGEINWEVGGGKYRMTTRAGLVILFASVNLLTLRSEGVIDEHGIAPVLSSEIRRGRSETATHFNREEKTISFSASTKTVAMSAGAQDKNTIIMQLAGIGNADARQMQPGKEFAIQIGENRDATVFQFIVQGQEQITTKLGNLTTWHLVRPPRAGSYNSRLDIWLAPGLQWYPVQIRNTESNGAVTTQSVTKITQKTDQGN
ncbi:MAG TPA: DUF3108 domain-containing protein [Undibacterium sp.]|nr:DUF3108 domain-containing protein [Undibacterium sp.]